MGKVLKIAGIILCFIQAAFLFSCDDSECSESVDTIMLVNFYDKTKFTLHNDTLAVWGLQNDSLLQDTTNNLNSLKLPLRMVDTGTTFIFDFVHPRDSFYVTDTIEFMHTNNVHFISEACGCAMFFVLDSIKYTRNYIDSIAINQHEITNELIENIQVFFNTTKKSSE